MENQGFWIAFAIILFVVLGPVKLQNFTVRGANTWRDQATFTTPGRNQRQRELAEDRASRRQAKEDNRDSAPFTNWDPNLKNTPPGGRDNHEESSLTENGDATPSASESESTDDIRTRRAAAAEARLAKDKANTELARRYVAQKKQQKKNMTALERASYENRGWRIADTQRDFMSYN